MAMSYTSLVASKGTSGSLANWVNYTKLDTVAVLDGAQSLLFGLLRVREMRKVWVFGLTAGQSSIALPSRFLDPIGRMFDIKHNMRLKHIIDTSIEDMRAYDTAFSGDFDADPFTTTSGSTLVSVELVGHGLTQGSTLTILEANDVGGLTLNGTFPVDSITDVDNLVIDVDEKATSAATGGGALAEYTANKLISSIPSRWSIYEERAQFDCAAEEAGQYRLPYFRSPELLSATNTTNWLTDRYSELLRAACMAKSADYMKDGTEYEKHLKTLTTLVGSTNVENDMFLRGAEFGTDTPTPGDYY